MATIKLSKQQWQFIGKKAGWMKIAQTSLDAIISNIICTPENKINFTNCIELANNIVNDHPEFAIRKQEIIDKIIQQSKDNGCWSE